jgi:outer membrane protein
VSGFVGWTRLVAIAAALLLWPVSASADTIEWALVQAYQNNPTVNAQRAAVRATDEAVPQALSGYRPRVSATASVAEQYLETFSKTSVTGPATYARASGNSAVQAYGATVTQTLLNGYQTANRTRQAEAQVSGAR